MRSFRLIQSSDRWPKQSHMADDSGQTDARIGVSLECRDLIRWQKRGGETFDSVLRSMAEQYKIPGNEVGHDEPVKSNQS